MGRWGDCRPLKGSGLLKVTRHSGDRAGSGPSVTVLFPFFPQQQAVGITLGFGRGTPPG